MLCFLSLVFGLLSLVLPVFWCLCQLFCFVLSVFCSPSFVSFTCSSYLRFFNFLLSCFLPWFRFVLCSLGLCSFLMFSLLFCLRPLVVLYGLFFHYFILRFCLLSSIFHPFLIGFPLCSDVRGLWFLFWRFLSISVFCRFSFSVFFLLCFDVLYALSSSFSYILCYAALVLSFVFYIIFSSVFPVHFFLFTFPLIFSFHLVISWFQFIYRFFWSRIFLLYHSLLF